MELSDARRRAEQLIEQMQPYCHRIEIAGSIRRGKPEVKDIEIVAAPKWEDRKCGGVLFAELEITKPSNLLFAWALAQPAAGSLQWIKPGTNDIQVWTPSPDGKYWRGLIGGEIKLDLFLASAENFGLIKMIRTGDSSFSREVVTYALKTNRRCQNGFLTGPEGENIPTPEEQDVFDILGIEWVEPCKRVAGMVRPFRKTI